jgi:beta-lactamase class A
MIRILFIVSLFLSLVSVPLFSQIDSLRKQIEKIVASNDATIGVAIAGMTTGDTLSINGHSRLPMQSVFKFHIALAVLDKVDKEKLSLNKKLYIEQSDLLQNTWSPLRDKYPKGNVEISLSEILNYTVSQSDNSGCDILLKFLGGPKVVQNYINKIGIKDFAIVSGEKEMIEDQDIQYKNWTTPIATVKLLKIFYDRKLLSSIALQARLLSCSGFTPLQLSGGLVMRSTNSYNFLWKILTETETGKNRIKGQLPSGTVIAHKTGTSDTNSEGITAAVNDIGIVQLPNKGYFIISVFVSDSKEEMEKNEKIIADISKLAWDYFLQKEN